MCHAAGVLATTAAASVVALLLSAVDSAWMRALNREGKLTELQVRIFAATRPAELARQHMSAPPDLTALPPADRR